MIYEMVTTRRKEKSSLYLLFDCLFVLFFVFVFWCFMLCGKTRLEWVLKNKWWIVIIVCIEGGQERDGEMKRREGGD